MIDEIHAVIVFLHDGNGSYLFQLRDNKKDIVFPGHWGMFGGEIKQGESPCDAGFRELKEEINYTPPAIYSFRQYQHQHVLQDQLRNYRIESCYGELVVPLSQLDLQEGMDLGLFSVNEILTGKLFSQKLKTYFPIVPPLMGYFFDYLNEEGV